MAIINAILNTQCFIAEQTFLNIYISHQPLEILNYTCVHSVKKVSSHLYGQPLLYIFFLDPIFPTIRLDGLKYLLRLTDIKQIILANYWLILTI